MPFEAESNSELTVIVPAYQLHFRFPVQKKNTQTKIFVGHPNWHIWQYCRSLWFSARSVWRISKSLYIVQIFRLPCKKNQPIYCQLTALYTYRIHITLKDMPVILHNFKQHVILKVLYKI